MEDASIEVDIHKSARHIIRRIHFKNLEGLKREIEKISNTKVNEVLEVNVDKVGISKDGDVQKCIYVEETVLSYAMENGTFEICKYLVEEVIKDYSIFRRIDINKFSPIHCAAINEDPNVFIMLNDATKGIIDNVNIPTKYGNTPLHFACKFGKPATVKALLNIESVAYNVKNYNGEYPIHWAAYGGHVDSVKHIFERYEEEDLKKNSKLIEEERVNVILNWEILCNTEHAIDESTLKRAEIEFLNILENEFQRKIVENDKEGTNSVLGDTWKNELKKKVKDELQKDITDKARKRAQLKLNKKFGEDCLKLEGKNCGVPLLCAALKVETGKEDDRHFKCIEFILDNQMNADSTCRDDDCDTALHFLSKKASPEQLAIVLKANALLGVKNEVGNVPLDWITKETMEKVLDNHLQKIEIKAKRNDFSTKDMYKILFTNLFGHHASGSDIKNILALAQSNNHQDLALHPVCQSILSEAQNQLKASQFDDEGASEDESDVNNDASTNRIKK
ncbi:hypothetical protein B566_EDAN002129 [Ephemera danica]|nr:hypothetical protein B566_EDAN002129 [Ephemera danica]